MEKLNSAWNIIPIKKETKIPAIKFEEFFNKRYEGNLKDHDGNFAVICGKISGNLVIIDLDYKNSNKKYFTKIFSEFHQRYPQLIDTLIAETPHGHHFFYYIDGDCPSRTLHQDTDKEKILRLILNKKNPTKTIVSNFPDLLDGVDILGEGGYAIIPPSKVKDGEYKRLNNKQPKKINENEFEQIVDFFLVENPKRNRMRDPFFKLLIGEIDIEEQAQLTGEKEFIYWKYLFLEAWHCLGLKPEEIIPFLEKNQSKFDSKTTQEQLLHINLDDKPLLNETLEKYFPYFKKEKAQAKIQEEKEQDYIRIADYLVKKYSLITMDDSEEILIHHGNTYSSELNEIKNELADLIGLTNKSFTSLEANILKRIKYKTRFSRSNFCYDNWLINFKNGYYDVKNKKFYPSNESPKLFCYEIPHDFIHEGDCPKFKQLLRDWLGEKNMIKMDDIFEMIGYTTTMNTDMKLAFFIYGPSHGGKTQFQTVLEHVIGHLNRANVDLQRLGKDLFGPHALQFALFDMVGDMSDLSIHDVSIFKTIAGGDKYVPAEVKGGKIYQFRNICKMWFNGNKTPALERDDPAFYNRWILINFPNVFPMFDDKTIKGIGDRICEDENEINGIIHESLKGAERLCERKYFRREILTNTTHLWKYNAEPLYAFIYEHCNFDKEGEIIFDEFRHKLNGYLLENRQKPLSSYELNLQIENYGLYKIRQSSDDRDYIIKGICWKEKEIKIKSEEYRIFEVEE